MKKTNCFRINRIYNPTVFIFTAIIMILYCQPAMAKVSKDITFKWNANPTSEDIVGYRLYYGKKSRFNSSGTLKSNFQYDYCVDFAELVRCSGSNYSSCVDLGSAQLDCENLYSETPKCTLKNIQGYKYFSLTAYNNQDESGFTKELNLVNHSISTLTAVYNVLLN